MIFWRVELYWELSGLGSRITWPSAVLLACKREKTDVICKSLGGKNSTKPVYPALYLQCSGECPVLTVNQKQGGDSRVVQAERRTGQSLRLARGSADEEDGHLPHEEAASHPLEGVVSQEAHGVVQPAALVGLQRLQSLDVLQQGPFLQSVGKADLGGHLVVVKRQSHAGPPGTVALGDRDVPHQAQDGVAHGVEVLPAGSLRDVQGEGQLGGVQRALLLTCSFIHVHKEVLLPTPDYTVHESHWISNTHRNNKLQFKQIKTVRHFLWHVTQKD